MRRPVVTLVLACLSGTLFPQTNASDAALMTKIRGSYDAPFRRGLISFDCTVQFDWRKHFVDLFGAIPPAAPPIADRLQLINHRVFVDRSGAVVSAMPTAPDFTGIEHAAELEQGFKAIVSAGLSAWLPFSTSVILPVGPTNFDVQRVDTGYKITMNGPNVAATILLTEDLRITGAVSQLPQLMRLTTEFKDGPEGFVLASVKTTPATNPEATFSYTYQTVQGFQLPSLITVTPQGAPEVWHYALTDCKAITGVVIKVAPPPKP